MSRPWMPLYVADYLADTGHLSAAEHGAYLLLIMHYWVNGGLPAEDRKLARIARMSPRKWARVRSTIAGFFGPGWFHERIDIELRRKRPGCSWGIVPQENDLPPDWRERRLHVFRRDNFTCKYCGQHGGRLECDHIVPRARRGSHEYGNLATACYACNRAKRAKLLNEWKP